MVKAHRISESGNDVTQLQTFENPAKISLETKSSIYSLCPFLDEKGILRVRDRLQSSQLNLNAKHPVIIPAFASEAEKELNDTKIVPIARSLLALKFCGVPGSNIQFVPEAKQNDFYKTKKCILVVNSVNVKVFELILDAQLKAINPVEAICIETAQEKSSKENPSCSIADSIEVVRSVKSSYYVAPQ
ncbi:hypothetical protein NPIL_37531 [Nephila pilipes]|uniref:Uncharacterized protein n=1 Tax=Nephila pilipes TaxID=299642 RepID=A0A8X6Q4A4_NEPPI|nr:hypothetical protein NPIL_37531 [Nephila pilipes]